MSWATALDAEQPKLGRASPITMPPAPNMGATRTRTTLLLSHALRERGARDPDEHERLSGFVDDAGRRGCRVIEIDRLPRPLSALVCACASTTGSLRE